MSYKVDNYSRQKQCYSIICAYVVSCQTNNIIVGLIKLICNKIIVYAKETMLNACGLNQYRIKRERERGSQTDRLTERDKIRQSEMGTYYLNIYKYLDI